MWQYQTTSNISVNGVPKEEKENQAENKIIEIRAENFPKLIKPSVHRSKNFIEPRRNKEKHT